MRRILIAALTLLAFTISSAMADSWCDFDQGFLGTKAIGYVFPVSLVGYVVPDVTQKPVPEALCKVQTFNAPEGAGGDTLDCARFEYTPSPYIDKAAPAANDYFTLMVFETKGAFVQLHLAGGTAVWAKTNAADSVNPIGHGGVFPRDQIFAKPDHAYPASPLTVLNDQTIRAKIRALFAHTEFAKKDVIVYLRGENLPDFLGNNPLYVDFVYVNTKPFVAADGTQWLQAEERLQWDWQWSDSANKPPKPAERFQVDKDSEQYRTDALRTVYIPVRDASGRILNVAGYGNLYCD